MRRELKTYEYTCDFCGKIECVTTDWANRMPKDWKRVEIRSQDKFSTDRDACPECAKERKDVQWW